MKKRFVFITARRKELRGGNMKKRRLMLCSIISLIMVFVMAVPMTVSADTATTVTTGTLQEAIDKAADGAVIKLEHNFNESITIPAGKKITLDLNGQTLTGELKDGVASITNNGTLTIKDGVGNGKITRETAAGHTHYVIDNQGTLTIESGEVSIKSPVAMPKGASLIRNAGNGKEAATLTITGGKIFQDGFIAVKNDDLGILNITGGEIGTSGDTATNTASAVQNWGTANITGGTIGNIWTGIWDNKYESVTNISGNTTVAGTVVVKRDYTYGSPTKNPKLNITGGTFNVNWAVVKSEADITITGGNYTSAPDADFVAEDHLMIHYSIGGNDGRYYVGTNAEIQKIVDNAKSGDTIDVIHGNAHLTLTKPGVTIGNKGAEVVVVNRQELANGTTTVIKEVDPTKPSQDQTQKPSDTAKADKSAKTGDDFNLFAVGGVALAAIIAMAAVAITGRRHRQR